MFKRNLNVLTCDQSTVQSAMSFLLKKGSQSSFLFTAKTLDLRRKWVNAINMAK